MRRTAPARARASRENWQNIKRKIAGGTLRNKKDSAEAAREDLQRVRCDAAFFAELTVHNAHEA
jgi:hypothetical protein